MGEVITGLHWAIGLLAAILAAEVAGLVKAFWPTKPGASGVHEVYHPAHPVVEHRVKHHPLASFEAIHPEK